VRIFFEVDLVAWHIAFDTRIVCRGFYCERFLVQLERKGL
jgi:hypothetical protein